MNKQTLNQILFETKLIHKHSKMHQKRSQQSSRNHQYSNNNKIGQICLLGSLQLQQKPILPSHNPMNRFQIVQLKKHKPILPKRQQSKYDTALKSELKSRQIRSHRDSFKIDKIQHSQLGIFEKSFGIKFVQNPSYLMQGEVITNSKPTQNGRKSERNVNFSHGKSSLNIQLLPEKFIPSQVLSSKQYKRIYQEQKRKIIQQRNQSLKKSLYLDFQNVKFNLSEVKDAKEVQKISQTPIQMINNSQHFPQPQQSINRTTSMTMASIPRKHYLKKMFQQQKQFQDKLQMQKKQALQIRKQVNKNYAKPFNPPQNISAQAYIVYEITKKQSRYRKSFQSSNQKKRFQNGHKVLVQLNSRTPVQVASLTKIMAFTVALQICAKFNKEPNQQIIKIGMFQQNITGTTANLCKGEIYTLEQLFYGLMLPSGNDASLAIAVWGGKTIMEATQSATIEAEPSLMKRKKLFYDRFLEQMNKKAFQLGMQKTHYANSHGLMNFDNKSCAFDLALLCEYAMKIQKFKQVVKTRCYQCTVQSQKEDLSTIASPTLTNRSSSVNIEPEYVSQMRDFYADQKQEFQSEQKQKQFQGDFIEAVESQILSPVIQEQKNTSQLFTKKVYWQNTHFLVQQKPSLYKGIKTGITNAAGPCLASMVEHNQRQFIMIVLNCRTMKQRFKDTEALRKWAFQKQQIKLRQ